MDYSTYTVTFSISGPVERTRLELFEADLEDFLARHRAFAIEIELLDADYLPVCQT